MGLDAGIDLGIRVGVITTLGQIGQAGTMMTPTGKDTATASVGAERVTTTYPHPALAVAGILEGHPLWDEFEAELERLSEEDDRRAREAEIEER